MFQFTTTNVINSDFEYGYTPTGIAAKDDLHALWSVLPADPSKNRCASMNIKRIGNFKEDFVTHIYKAEATAPEFAEATLDFSKITTAKEGDKLRLDMYIGLSLGSNNAMYANDTYYKGKPVFIDFDWKASAAATVKDLVKTIKKFLVNVHGEKMFEIEYTGSVITITAVTEYQRFNKVEVQLLDPTALHNMGEFKVVLAATEEPDETTGDVTLKQGKEGFGTYEWILHNLRIPTSARTGFKHINEEEDPIPGAMYNQYTIHYCVNRGTLGLNAVGHQVTSHTTHVFYVREDLVPTFETALSEIGVIEQVP